MRTAWALSLRRQGASLLAVILCAVLALPTQALTSNTRVASSVRAAGETVCTGVFEAGAQPCTGLFAADNPVNMVDPSGYIGIFKFTRDFGYQAHQVIENQYQAEHPGAI